MGGSELFVRQGTADRDPHSRYKKFELLGSGACKKVYKAFDEERGMEVAWNQVCVGEFVWASEKERSRVFAEIRVLRQLKHKNIISMHDWWYDAEEATLNFITELFTDGTLRQYRRKHKHLESSAIKRWAWQMLQGLVYLHGHNPPIIHRDLKADNIFVNGSSGTIKIGDLGFATLHQVSVAMSVIGTPEFMAPELYEEQYSEKVDVYSYGMCLLELATMQYPYSECKNAAQIYKKVVKGIPPDGLALVKDPEMKAFIQLCICHDPVRRPEARQLLKHPFFECIKNACPAASGRSLVAPVPALPPAVIVPPIPPLSSTTSCPQTFASTSGRGSVSDGGAAAVPPSAGSVSGSSPPDPARERMRRQSASALGDLGTSATTAVPAVPTPRQLSSGTLPTSAPLDGGRPGGFPSAQQQQHASHSIAAAAAASATPRPSAPAGPPSYLQVVESEPSGSAAALTGPSTPASASATKGGSVSSPVEPQAGSSQHNGRPPLPTSVASVSYAAVASAAGGESPLAGVSSAASRSNGPTPAQAVLTSLALAPRTSPRNPAARTASGGGGAPRRLSELSEAELLFDDHGDGSGTSGGPPAAGVAGHSYSSAVSNSHSSGTADSGHDLGSGEYANAPVGREESAFQKYANTLGPRGSGGGVDMAGHHHHHHQRGTGGGMGSGSASEDDGPELVPVILEDGFASFSAHLRQNRVSLACRGRSDKMLNFTMSFTNHAGRRKRIGFQYDEDTDTANDIAQEMVENLSLDVDEAQVVAQRIQDEIRRFNAEVSMNGSRRLSGASSFAGFSPMPSLNSGSPLVAMVGFPDDADPGPPLKQLTLTLGCRREGDSEAARSPQS